MMNWDGCRRKRSWSVLTYCRRICTEGMRKTTGDLSPGQDSNPESPEYVREPQLSVKCHTVASNIQGD